MGQTKNNGAEPQPDRKILRLSDLYTVRMKETQLELTAVLLNINRNHNRELMEACRDLKDYAEYVDRVRKYPENCLCQRRWNVPLQSVSGKES